MELEKYDNFKNSDQWLSRYLNFKLIQIDKL